MSQHALGCKISNATAIAEANVNGLVERQPMLNGMTCLELWPCFAKRKRLDGAHAHIRYHRFALMDRMYEKGLQEIFMIVDRWILVLPHLGQSPG